MKNLTKNIILTVLGLVLSYYSVAQTEVFKVIASRGKNTLSDGTVIFAGKKLVANDIIKINERSYLGLIHTSGKTVEIKELGTYKVSDLVSKVVAKNNSISKKYADYVVSELIKSERVDIHTNYQKNMKVTGSVERAVSSATIPMFLPKISSIINKLNTVIWMKNTKVTSYTVEILNLFDDIIFTKETTDTSFTFNIDSIKVPNDNTLMIRIKCNSNLKSDSYVLKILQQNKNTEVYVDKDMITKEYSEESALNYMMKASFYAQNNLFIDAKKSFENAIVLEPSVVEYKSVYMNYLTKNNLLEFYPYEK